MQRQLMVISGTPQWAIGQAEMVLDALRLTNRLWVGSGQQDGVLTQHFRQHLGREYQALVYNGFDGMRASALAALSGTVVQSGLMIILTPALADWPTYQDPQKPQRISYGFLEQARTSHFTRWLVGLLRKAPDVVLYSHQEFRGTNVPLAPAAPFAHSLCKSAEQLEIIEAIERLAKSTSPYPLVLTADRGRGKSSALGIAAASLIKQGKHILLCAPVVAAVEQVFIRAQALLAPHQRTKQELSSATGKLFFQPVDRILLERPKADILFVDEAAAIPAPLLQKLCEQYPRIVFSTTIHGYEGSGRGFEIRFRRYLQEHHPGFVHYQLHQPIRWQTGDPLERFWFEALLMTSSSYRQICLGEGELSCHFLSGQALQHQHELLHQAFELMINAHYQTTPDDLVRIFDGPDQCLCLLVKHGRVLAAAQINLEGNQALAELARDITEGRRRVKGHLLPQRLSFVFKCPELVNMRYWRIVRIAVQPEYQQQGLGSQLLAKIESKAKNTGMDFLGSSFAAGEDILAFWQKARYQLIYRGTKKDASSGEVSALVLKPLSPSAEKAQNRLLTLTPR